MVVPTLGRWFFKRVVDGAAAALPSGDGDIVLFQAGHRNPDLVAQVRRARGKIDALVVAGVALDRQQRDSLAGSGLPVVTVGSRITGLPYHGIDQLSAARAATEHLIALGHRDIAHLGATYEAGLDRTVASGRYLGWRHAIQDAGFGMAGSPFVAGEFDLQLSRQRVAELLDSPRPPTAIFAASDEMAIGALLAAADAGRQVPDDVSIIGIDDGDISEAFGLTTLAQSPTAQIAGAIDAALNDSSTDAAAERSAIYPVTLLSRGSTAPPASPRR